MAEATTENEVSSGVQELITRIRDTGVKAGQDKADEIVRAARQEAAEITTAATAEAKETLEKARATIASEEKAAMDALRNAARDTVLQLKARVRSGFEQHIARIVSEQTKDDEFLRSMVLVLAGAAADEYIKDKDARIFITGDASTSEEKKRVDDRVRNALLGLSGEMLRKGIELIPAANVGGGARVRLVGQDLEIDLTDEAITGMLLDRVLPRFRRIIENEE